MQDITVLFIHGAWHTPAHFGPMIEEMKQRGVEALCPVLPSCDPQAVTKSPLPNLFSDADLIESELRKLVEQNKRVLVVAHSYGSLPTTQAVKEEFSLKQRASQGKEGGVVGLLFMASGMGEVGSALEDYSGGQPAPFIQVDEQGITSVNPEVAKAIFYNDLDPEAATTWANQLVSQPRQPFMDKLTYSAWRQFPVGCIVCDKDMSQVNVVQQMLIKDWATKDVTIGEYHCDAGHSPYLSQVKAVADIVQEFAKASLQ